MQGAEAARGFDRTGYQYRARQVTDQFNVGLHVGGHAFELFADHVLNLVEGHAGDELTAHVGQGDHALVVDAGLELGAAGGQWREQGRAFRRVVGDQHAKGVTGHQVRRRGDRLGDARLHRALGTAHVGRDGVGVDLDQVVRLVLGLDIALVRAGARQRAATSGQAEGCQGQCRQFQVELRGDSRGFNHDDPRSKPG
ncbi:hypothetical protein D3C72_1762300 [compost metagenome]